MFENTEDELQSALGRANMTAMITQTSMTGNPPGVSQIQLFPINTCLHLELA